MKDIEFSGFGFNLFGSGDLQISPIAIFVAGGILILVMLIYYFRQKRFKSATIKYSDVAQGPVPKLGISHLRESIL